MDKKYSEYLIALFNANYEFFKKEFNLKNYKEFKRFCNNKNTDFNATDFKIEEKHEIPEYFDKYLKSIKKKKAAVYTGNQLFIMNKKSKYWKIPNETDLLYFETPSFNRRYPFFFLWLFLILAVIGTGAYGIYHHLNPVPPLPPTPKDTTAEVEMDEESQTKYPGYSLIIEKAIATIDEDFDTDIYLNAPTYFINDERPVLHAKCESVISNEISLSEENYEYRVTNEERNQAHIHIPGAYVKGPINIKLELISSEYFCCRSTANGDVFYPKTEMDNPGLSLQNALDEVQDDETITILKPWTYNSDVEFIGLDSDTRTEPYPTHFTLDGNHQKLRSSCNPNLELIAFLQFETTDNGSSETDRHNARVDLKNLDIETTGYYYSLGYNGGNDGFTTTCGEMRDCKIYSDQTCLFVSGNDYGESDVQLYDCDFTHHDGGDFDEGAYNSVIAPQYDGHVIIHSGTYTSTDTGYGVRILNTGGLVNIEGGTIKAMDALYVLYSETKCLSWVHRLSEINVYHGTLIGNIKEPDGIEKEQIRLYNDVTVEGEIDPTVQDFRS